MEINIKITAPELVPGIENGIYEMQEGMSVREVLHALQERCGTCIPEENYKLMYPLFNGKPVKLTAPLTKSGTLYMCRVVMGG